MESKATSAATLDVVQLSGPAQQLAVDLLAFSVFGEAGKDALFKSIDSALGGVLADVARSEQFDGKPGQSIVVHTHGRLPAKRVLVVGAGARNELGNPSVRDIAATVAQTANRVGAVTVGFVMPNLGASREAHLLQHVVEGVH